MGGRGGSGGGKGGGGGGGGGGGIGAQLNAASSRDEVNSLLAGQNKAQLAALAKQLGVNTTGATTRAALAEQIYTFTAGARLYREGIAARATDLLRPKPGGLFGGGSH